VVTAVGARERVLVDHALAAVDDCYIRRVRRVEQDDPVDGGLARDLVDQSERLLFRRETPDRADPRSRRVCTHCAE
jgi:hypothetical protein